MPSGTTPPRLSTGPMHVWCNPGRGSYQETQQVCVGFFHSRAWTLAVTSPTLISSSGEVDPWAAEQPQRRGIHPSCAMPSWTVSLPHAPRRRMGGESGLRRTSSATHPVLRTGAGQIRWHIVFRIFGRWPGTWVIRTCLMDWWGRGESTADQQGSRRTGQLLQASPRSLRGSR